MFFYIALALVLVIPALFWRYGKRWFGAQTHPAALFLLAWMATAFLLSSSEAPMPVIGVMAGVWVLFSFGVMALFDRLRRKPAPGPDDQRP